jgi:hypothetical protein
MATMIIYRQRRLRQTYLKIVSLLVVLFLPEKNDGIDLLSVF